LLSHREHRPDNITTTQRRRCPYNTEGQLQSRPVKKGKVSHCLATLSSIRKSLKKGTQYHPRQKKAENRAGKNENKEKVSL